MKRSRLIFIVGPTASGKTALALLEAERMGASILSCDSLCVYREMDIGTAKPTREEQQRAPHFGLDLCDPATPFSVQEYIKYRDEVLQEHLHAGKPLLVAGGSGFYLKSFFTPVTDQLNIPDEIRERVESVRIEKGLDGLITGLREANPVDESFEGLDLDNMRRVEKALIRCLASGKQYSLLLREFAAMPPPLPEWEKEVWMVTRSRESLQKRNEKRVSRMLKAGLVEEVRTLRGLGFESNPSACGSIGYKEVLEFLDGRLDEDQLIQQIVIHTNQLMRKQRTWFRHQIPVNKEMPS